MGKMPSNGKSLVELRAIVRMLSTMLDIADEEGEETIAVEDVRELRDKYQKNVAALERLSS